MQNQLTLTGTGRGFTSRLARRLAGALLLSTLALVTACSESSNDGQSRPPEQAVEATQTAAPSAGTGSNTGPAAGSTAQSPGSAQDAATRAAERFFEAGFVTTRDNCKAPLKACLQTSTSSPSSPERGIATFGYTPVADFGGALVIFGRQANGEWGYWFGTQNTIYNEFQLPGPMRVCADGEGANVRQQPDGGSASVGMVKDLTMVTAEEFVLTQPGKLEPLTAGMGWYRVSAPLSGFVRSDLLSNVRLADCSVRDQIVKPR